MEPPNNIALKQYLIIKKKIEVKSTKLGGRIEETILTLLTASSSLGEADF